MANLRKFLNWSLSFFKSKKIESIEKEKSVKIIEPQKPRKSFGKGRAFKNNRKSTKSRIIQRIFLGINNFGTPVYKYIYHYAH